MIKVYFSVAMGLRYIYGLGSFDTFLKLFYSYEMPFVDYVAFFAVFTVTFLWSLAISFRVVFKQNSGPSQLLMGRFKALASKNHITVT